MNPQSSHKWVNSISRVNLFVFKISTPYGSGTGVQLSYSRSQNTCAIATAYHVIQHADEWEESIRITQYPSGKSIVLKAEARAVVPYPEQDLALIIFNVGSELDINTPSPKLVPAGKWLKQGIEIAWLGFPSVSPNSVCFFDGYVSAYLKKEMSYLVDGVAINGVSGGPAFFIEGGSNETKICGLISAYIPNRSNGEVLPGLSYVISVEPYQQKIAELESLDEAKQKAEEQKQSISASPSPSSSTSPSTSISTSPSTSPSPSEEE